MNDPAANDVSPYQRGRWFTAGIVSLLLLLVGFSWHWQRRQFYLERVAHKNEMCRTCIRMLGFLISDHDKVRRIDGLHINAFKDCLPLAHHELTPDGKTRLTWTAEHDEEEVVMIGGFVIGTNDRIEEPWFTILY